MFAIVIVGPSAAAGLLSLDDAAAVFDDLLEPPDPPHPVMSAPMRAIAAKNIPIFFILNPNFSPSRDTISGPKQFRRMKLPLPHPLALPDYEQAERDGEEGCGQPNRVHAPGVTGNRADQRPATEREDECAVETRIARRASDRHMPIP